MFSWWRKRDDCEHLRFMLAERARELVIYEQAFRNLSEAAHDVCVRYVAPEFQDVAIDTVVSAIKKSTP